MDSTFKKWQEIWQKDESDIPDFSQDVLNVRQYRSYIDKIRRNLRLEFFLGVAFIVFCIFFASMKSSGKEQQLILLGFSVTLSAVLLFYGFRFYRFYKASYYISYNSKMSLLWYVSEIRLLMEVYRSFSYIMIFCAFFYGFLYGLFEEDTPSWNLSPADSITLSIVLFVIVLVLCLLLLEGWIYWAYGRYVRKLGMLLQELTCEDHN